MTFSSAPRPPVRYLKAKDPGQRVHRVGDEALEFHQDEELTAPSVGIFVAWLDGELVLAPAALPWCPRAR